MTKTGALILSLASMQDGNPPPWIQLLPIGTAKPKDSRAAWHVKNPQAIALASAKHLPMLIDVDHIADAQPQGTRNPAYGWIEEIAPAGPNGEDGVWGRVDWTGLGVKALAAKEYRYLSPVFFHNETTRHVQVIVRATLTNDPALSLKALASRQANDPENPMSLAAIAAALALAATASEAEILAAIAQRDTESKALASRLRNVATAAGLAEAQDVDDNAVLAIASKLKAPAKAGEGFVAQAEFDRLQLELASVQKAIASGAASTAVDAAIRAGKLVPAQRDWAVGYASREPDAFKAFVAAQPAILSDGRIAEAAPAEGQLTAEQKALCSNLGITEEAFVKELAAAKKGTA